MANLASSRNIGAYLTFRPGVFQGSLTAGGTGDNTTIAGSGIDRTVVGYPQSLALATDWKATMASGNTLTLTTKIQDSADNSTFADFATEAATVVGTGQSGGGEISGTHALNVDLSGARQYVRATVLPDLSAAGTDTGVVHAVIAFGGAAELAAPA